MTKKNIKSEGMEEFVPSAKKNKQYIVLVPIFLKGERKEIGEVIELTIEEYKSISELVSELRE